MALAFPLKSRCLMAADGGHSEMMFVENCILGFFSALTFLFVTKEFFLALQILNPLPTFSLSVACVLYRIFGVALY